MNNIAKTDVVLESYRDRLYGIKQTLGLSRRELAKWLGTSVATLNSISKEQHYPNDLLVHRIENLLKVINRIETLYDTNLIKTRQILEMKSNNQKSALELLLEDDYQQAATVIQQILRPKVKIKPIRGDKFYNSKMIAVEEL